METGFETLGEVIEFAIMREEDARQFYVDLSQRTEDPFMKQIFADFAEEELKHKNTLENLSLEGLERIFDNILKKVNDLHIAEQVPEVEPGKDLDFVDALTLAMKREDKSYRLYSLLAEMSEDESISLLFVGLAKEEAHHKHRIEQAYKSLYLDTP